MVEISSKKGRATENKATEWIKEQGYNIINEDTRKGHEGRFGGWPDRLAIDEDDHLHFFEIKEETHELDPHQEKVLNALKRCGTVHVLVYKDFEMVEDRILK